MNKKGKLEKKIYECLGVNIFRKKFLFTYEKIMKFFKFDVGYRLNSMDVEGLKNYKKSAKEFAIGHFWVAILVINLGIMNLVSPVKFLSFGGFLFNFLLNVYCIMVQRYNYIRIEEVEEKFAKYQQLKKKREEYQELKKKRQKRLEKNNTLSSEKVNELINIFSGKSQVVNNSLKDEGYMKIIDIKPYMPKQDPLSANYWLNKNTQKAKNLVRKLG